MSNQALPWEQHGPLRMAANGHFLEHADALSFSGWATPPGTGPA
jgi:hypothetical protein